MWAEAKLCSDRVGVVKAKVYRTAVGSSAFLPAVQDLRSLLSDQDYPDFPETDPE